MSIAGSLIAFSVQLAHAETPYDLKLPRGFPRPSIPADNPLTVEKVELGRFLFYDPRLSGNGSYSCATCHQQGKAFTDGLPRALGSTGEVHPRSAMSIANVAYASTLAWANPNLFILETQALVPMFGEHPIELGLAGKEEELLNRLREDSRYQRMFAEAFPNAEEQFSLETITRALGSFERTLISGNSPYDRYVFGVDDDAISSSAKRGEILFFDEMHECFHCHGGFNLTTSVVAQGMIPERPFHNTALYNLRCADFDLPQLDLTWCDPPPTPERCAISDASQPLGCFCEGPGPQAFGCYPTENTGKFDLTQSSVDMGRFKAPTLRNIAVTAPYMHDGSIATLEEVIDHYAAGGRTIVDGPYAGEGRKSPAKGAFMRGFPLNAQDKADLVAFLSALTDEEFLTDPRFANPFETETCPGDCNRDGAVDISELVASIGVSLGSATLASCVVTDPSGNGQVTVDELVRAISNALNGCA